MPTERILELKRTRVPKYYTGEAYVSEIYFSILRSQAYTKVWKETEGEPVSIRRAKTLAYYLETMPIFIRPQTLLVGYHAEAPQAMTFNIEQINPIAINRFIDLGFVRDGDVPALRECMEYWKTRNLQSMLNNYYSDEERQLLAAGHRYVEGSPAEVSTFTQPDHDIYLDNGLNKIIEQLGEKLAKLKEERETCDNSPKLVEICLQINDAKAMIIACEAVIAWANRYSKLAAEMAEAEPNQVRKEELQKISEICAWVPANPARNLWEAMQSHWFVFEVYHQIEAQAAGVSLRLDQIFWKYYEKDVVIDRTLSRELAIELIQNMMYKADELGWAAPKDYHQTLQGTNQVAVYTIGGVKTDGTDASNELTMTILDAIEDMRLSHPDFKFRYNPNGNPKVWNRVVEVIRSGLGQPSIKNDEVNIRTLIDHYGLSLEEARSWAAIGCACSSPTINNGRARNSGFSAFPAKYAELALNNGIDPVPLNGQIQQIGPQTGDSTEFSNMEDLLEAFRKQTRWALRISSRVKYLGETAASALLKRPFVSCLFHRSFDACRDIMDTPCASTAYFVSPGMIDAVDSMITINKLVFVDKKYTMPQVLEALKANWEGYEVMQQDFINATKFGNDDDFADDMAKRVYYILAEEGMKVRDYDGGKALPAILALTWTFTLSTITGALPNGRKLGDLLADGGGPHAGYDRKGPMSSVLSVSKLDASKFRYNLYNQKFSALSVAGDVGLKKLKNHIEAAMKLGVEMIQFNVVDRETLISAQDHPEEYMDLVVRVSGYNVRFVDLPRFLQDGIIERTEHAAV